MRSYRRSHPHAPRTSRHIYDAQMRLPNHWAAWYSTVEGTPLSRLTGKARIDRNRRLACKGFVKRNRSDSCDEFPFASTYQGAYFIPSARRRSVRHVPLSDNNYAGTMLSTFYNAWRVVDGEKFYITVGS